MAAYVISDVEFLDPALVDSYRALAQASIARYGGRYIIRGLEETSDFSCGYALGLSAPQARADTRL